MYTEHRLEMTQLHCLILSACLAVDQLIVGVEPGDDWGGAAKRPTEQLHIGSLYNHSLHCP